MPLTIKKIKNKFRLVEQNTQEIAKNKAGTPIDGGGHGSHLKAMKQATAIRFSKARNTKAPRIE